MMVQSSALKRCTCAVVQFWVVALHCMPHEKPIDLQQSHMEITSCRTVIRMFTVQNLKAIQISGNISGPNTSHIIFLMMYIEWQSATYPMIMLAG